MFKLLNTENFTQHQIIGKLYRHECGLEVLSLEASDPENLFAIFFNTVPTDNTGVPHILEHSVLAGSRKYPVKDPFVEMLKTSVATFINALTYPDRTVYPCTSCCRKDYFNLFDVYWDAVFHPALSRDTFLREGWHYELAGKGGKQCLRYNGIVFNEMSGYYSNVATVLERSVNSALFGGTSLKYESGGVPDAIPKLTYNQFRRYHHEHYAPQVARIVLYGNIPTEDKLNYIEEQLSRTLPVFGMPCTAKKILPGKDDGICHAGMKIVPHVPEPSAARDECIVALVWDVASSDSPRNPEDDLGLQLLENVLFGSSGAPMTRKLMSSHIGTAPMAMGYDNETRYCSFSVAMRGVKWKNRAKFVPMVLDELRNIVKNGLDPVFVQTAVSAYQLDNQGVSSQYVFELMEDIIASWNYGDDPFVLLRQSEQLPKIQELLSRNPRYFEDLIQRCLLDNPRHVCVCLKPDKTLKGKMERKRKEKLAAAFAKMTPRQLKKISDDTRRLEESALRMDSAESLASLPQLHRLDLPASITPMPYENLKFRNGLAVRRGKVNYNGIAEMAAVLDISNIPEELILDLPIFCTLFRTLGNKLRDYASNCAEIARLGCTYTLALKTFTSIDSPKIYRGMMMTCVGLENNFSDCLEMFRQQLDGVIFSERARIVEIFKAAAAARKSKLTTRNNIEFCASRAACGLIEDGEVNENISGFHGYFRTLSLAALDENNLDGLAERLQRIAGFLRTLPVVAVGVQGNDRTVADVEDFCMDFPCSTEFCRAVEWPRNEPLIGQAAERHEFCGIQTNVASCVRMLPGLHSSHPLFCAANVLLRMLNIGFLWDEIRAKGGAYHAHVKYDHCSRMIELASSEDPNPENTYRVFDAIQAEICGKKLNLADVDKAVIACSGKFINPVRPLGYAAVLALNSVCGNDDRRRQEKYEKLRMVTPGQMQEACDLIFPEKMRQYNDCAIGPAGALKNFSEISLK